MKTTIIVSLVAVAAILTAPAPASAWLICDPCCGKRQVADEAEGRELAGYYAQAGVAFSSALDAMEKSNLKSAHKSLNLFFGAINQMNQKLAIPEMKQQLAVILTMRDHFEKNLKRKLPELSAVVALGKAWAQLQFVANKAVAAKCR